ncbi:extracellular calcium-sensing receptor-like [Protopterus annectens]|uniref:extracellular calcium-sensing receptor-like n=1 Tax=Protopterus annectens TaxID=7888 RepID=UPI001CFA72D5|nr:extracellular calcium-sensing receptor-like [Protopterus annectens]
MVFAIEELNQNPKILPNITLGFKIFDSCYSEFRALRGTFLMLSGGIKEIPNYRCQTDQPLSGIVGDAQAKTSLPMARVLGLYGYPQISHGSAVAVLSNKQQFPSFLRTMTNDNFQYPVLTHLITHFSWTWIGIIASDNEYGLLGSQNLKTSLSLREVCVAFSEIISLGISMKRLLQIVDVIKKSNLTVIVVYATRMELFPLIDEIARQNITGKVWLATISWIISPIFSKRLSWKALNGTFGLATHKGVIPGLKEFIYMLHPFTATDDIFVKSFWEETFSCSWPTDNHAKQAKDVNTTFMLCTGEEKLDYYDLSKFNLFDFRYAYNAYKAVYAIAHGLHALLNCNSSSEFYAYKTCKTFDYRKSWQLLHHVKNVFFKDISGEELFFDQNGDSPAMYDILNWQVSPDGNTTKYVKVGYFDSRAPPGQQFFIKENLILWNGDNTQIPRSVCSEPCPLGSRKAARRGQPVCCFDCIPCSKGEISNQTGASNCIRCAEDKWPNLRQDTCKPKDVEFLSFEEALGSALAGSSVFFTLMAASTLCIFIKYRDTPIVKANNRDLSYLILSSIFLCFLCPLVFIGQPNIYTCLLRQTSFGIIFSFCVSGILAKTITIVIVFKATNPNSKLMKYVGPRTPYCIIFSGSLLQVTLCIIWLAMSPPVPELNFSSEEFKIIIECKEGSFVMFYCMLGYLGLLASTCFVVAFLARTLPDSFNEAKFISFSMIIFASVWLSFIPAYLSTKGKYMVAVEIFAIMASGSGIIICIFFPKCYIILLRPELNTRGQLMGNTNVSRKM